MSDSIEDQNDQNVDEEELKQNAFGVIAQLVQSVLHQFETRRAMDLFFSSFKEYVNTQTMDSSHGLRDTFTRYERNLADLRAQMFHLDKQHKEMINLTDYDHVISNLDAKNKLYFKSKLFSVTLRHEEQVKRKIATKMILNHKVDKVESSGENGGLTEKLYKCALPCPHSFDQLEKLEDHYDRAHSIKFRCLQCRDIFDQRKLLMDHLQKGDCFETFPNKISTPEKVKEKEGNENGSSDFVCDQCLLGFKRRINLRLHQNVHLTDRGSSLASPEDSPPPEKKFRCDIEQCDRWFQHRHTLRRHQTKFH